MENTSELETIQQSLWVDKVSQEMYPKGFVHVGPEKCIWPRQLLDYSETIEHFWIKDDDIWIIGYPKCGTTWCQEMVGLIVNASNADVSESVTSPIKWKGTTYFERTALYAQKATEGMNSFQKTEKQETPRVIKSHLGLSLLPKGMRDHVLDFEEEGGPKLIYIARDPKAACLSHFHESKGIDRFSGNLDEFVTAFVAGAVVFSPFWNLMKSYWSIRQSPHILFVKYEDMKNDLKNEIGRVANFLNRSVSAAQLEKITEQLSFENMKKCPEVNKEDVRKNLQQVVGEDGFTFMRKGKVDSWREEMMEDQIKMIDEWTKDQGIPELYP